MIKKWKEYLKESITTNGDESFIKLTKTDDDVYKYTIDILDSVFFDVQKKFDAISDTNLEDLEPNQVMEINNLKGKLAKIITNQVLSNIELEKQTSEHINLEELLQLEDERLEVKEGDEVIVVYPTKNVYKFKLEKPTGVVEDYGLGCYHNNRWWFIKNANLVVKVDTYNDFTNNKRL